MIKINEFKMLGVAAAFAAAFGGYSAAAQAQIVKIDGSSTVFPITEAVAEEFQKSKKGADQGDGGHLRHRRRLQEVLPRRDRHLRCLAPDH